uniref:Golgi membrane protein 1 n=1 Tax=Nothobranchius korthausae TaxID=1143690 RepID=A0A1A8G0F6_9TELE
MGGLGNGRRGGRSPPLMIAALVACILVLGFNYWVSSSRNLELQTKLYELEGQVRRGAAERGAAETKKMEFQVEIQKHKEQITQIESMYKRQLEGAQATCSQEKTKLQQNISSSTKTIQDLKGQLNQLNGDLGKFQKTLQSCQSNMDSLDKKLTSDLTRCESRVQSQKKLCDEKLAAEKREIQRKTEKPAGVSSQVEEKGAEKMDTTVKTVAGEVQTTSVLGHTPIIPLPKGNKSPQTHTNNVITDRDSEIIDQSQTKDVSKVKLSSAPVTAVVKEDKHQPGEEDVDADTAVAEAKISKDGKDDLTENKGMEVMDTHDEGAQTEEPDPGMEGMLIDQGRPDEIPVGQKLEEPDEYDGDEQVVGGVDLEKQQRSRQDKEMEEELADYNGDDENEGEFEADKQAALAQI